MILLGTVGGRWTASSIATSRPSPATRASPWRTTSVAKPSRKMRRYSVTREDQILRCGESAVRTGEPDVHLPGSHGVLVVAVLDARRGAGLLTDGARGEQPVAEHRLWPHLVERRHRVEHLRVVARPEPVESLVIGGECLLREDVARIGHLVLAQLAQLVERVREGARGQDDDLTIACRDRLADGATRAEEVLVRRGLTDADADPLLVGEPFAQILPEVDRRVHDRQVGVVDRGDPGAVLLRAILHEVRELRVAPVVVGHRVHPSWQLL